MSAQFHLLHRYYDPTTGQFLSVDPLVALTGQSYAYTGDNPVNGRDRSGESGISAGTICGEDGPKSAACKGAIQISAQVGKEVAANQISGCAPIIDIAGMIMSHWRGELEVGAVVLSVAAAVATGGSSLAAEGLIDTAVEGGTDVTLSAASGSASAEAPTAASSIAQGLNASSTALSGVGCAMETGDAQLVSCASAVIGAGGLGVGAVTRGAPLSSGPGQVSLGYGVTSVVLLIPGWATSVNRN